MAAGRGGRHQSILVEQIYIEWNYIIVIAMLNVSPKAVSVCLISTSMQEVTQSKVITDKKDQEKIWRGRGSKITSCTRGSVKAKIACSGRESRKSHRLCAPRKF